ncbi:MAG: hypothetical protein Q8Q20_05240 [bacterium]|nr:hypothetical protein [bacterium]
MAKSLTFVPGQQVVMMEGQEAIDRGVIRRVTKGGHPERQVIDVESRQVAPNTTTSFVFIPHQQPERAGWRMLFRDPMTDELVFSQRAPCYRFVAA